MNTPESWLPIAQTLGFATEKEMLEHLYVKEGWSIDDIAKRLGYARINVRKRLLQHNITLRGRGGNNRHVTDRLAAVEDLSNPTQVAKQLGLHPSTAYKERRRRCSSASSVQQENSTDLPPEANGT